MKFYIKNYNSRSELEKHIMTIHSLTPEKKDSTIEGTKEELTRLQLSSKSVFWGLSCIATDEVVVIKEAPPKVFRGERVDSSINDNLKIKK